MSSDRDFDALLDSALRAYSGGEAPLGLEARVLRAVEGKRRPSVWWWGMVPVVGVAALAFVSLLPPPTIDVPLPDGRGSVTPPEIAYNFTPPYTPPYRAATVRERDHQSLSPQQRALLELATKSPEEIAAMMPSLPGDINVQPLEIAPINIAELE